MREYNATVGATDGNIIAAIITIQTREEPTERSESGPRTVVHPLHLAGRPPPARCGDSEEQRDQTESSAHRSERGASPARRTTPAAPERVIESGGPGELGR